MSLAQRMHFLQDVFQMTAIALVSVINHYHINGWIYFETPRMRLPAEKGKKQEMITHFLFFEYCEMVNKILENSISSAGDIKPDPIAEGKKNKCLAISSLKG